MLNNLTVNKLIEIQPPSASPDKTYKSRVEEINDKGIWVANPTKQGALVTLPLGTEIKVTYGDELCIYSFKTIIKSKVNSPLPMLLLEKPDPKSIERIQRREFVRVPANTPFEYGIITTGMEQEGVDLHKTNTLDISGGGLRFLTNMSLQEKDLLQINLTLENELMILIGQIMRISDYSKNNNPGLKAVGVKFVNIHEADRDKIIKFVFDWQRQMRRKGLL